jgi:hypothetical protein
MSAEHLVSLYGTAMVVCAPDGLPLDTDDAAVELIGEATISRAGVVVVPVERLTDDFFDLRTGIAARITRKLGTYRVQLAVVGDVTERVVAGDFLSTWAAEPDGAPRPWFFDTFDELRDRIRPRP